MLKSKRLVSALFGMAMSFPSVAGISSDLESHFNRLGFSANVTNPSAYKSQAAGSFGSGSLVSRTSVRVFRLIQLDLPSFKTGCAGIDLYTGALSFLSGDRLKELGKAVMSNSGAYAFDLALATTIPQLKTIKDIHTYLENRNEIGKVQSSQKLG